MKKLLIPAVILSLAIAISSCRSDDPEARATGISLTPQAATLAFGDTLRLAATVFPTDAVDRSVTWESSADTVATVDTEGLVTVVTGDGVTTITATTVDGGFTAQSIITVTSSILANGCNTRMPNWGPGLGTISFATDSTWEIRDDNGVLIQTWSDAVTASNCSNRTAFNGGANDEYGFNADCRSNPNFKGDAFSWCAVVRFANQLCPYPWRVPTPEDFVALNTLLGGTATIGRILSDWGGAFAGSWEFLPSLEIVHNSTVGNMGFYWTVAEVERPVGMMGGALEIGTPNWGGWVTPESSLTKHTGTTLRCVK